MNYLWMVFVALLGTATATTRSFAGDPALQVPLHPIFLQERSRTTPFSFRDLVGEDPHVFETAARIIQIQNPNFLSVKSPCSLALSKKRPDPDQIEFTESHFLDLLGRARRLELQPLIQEWTSRLAHALAHPGDKTVRRWLQIDVSAPSDTIRFIEGNREFKITGDFAGPEKWTGFALSPVVKFPDGDVPEAILQRVKGLALIVRPKAGRIVPVQGDSSGDGAIPVTIVPPMSFDAASRLITTNIEAFEAYMEENAEDSNWSSATFQHFFRRLSDVHQNLMRMHHAARGEDQTEQTRQVAQRLFDRLPLDLGAFTSEWDESAYKLPFELISQFERIRKQTQRIADGQDPNESD